MKTSEILKKALEVLGPNGEHWTQLAMARNSAGQETLLVEDAVSFCGMGAVFVTVTGHVRRYDPADSLTSAQSASYRACFNRLSNSVPKNDFVIWQDRPGRTFAEVKQAFLSAIAAAEAHELAAQQEAAS